MDDWDTMHRIAICTRCAVAGARPGMALQQSLRARVDADPKARFRVDGIACMAGCDRPVTVGFSAPGKASYLFGDIDALRDAEHVLAFAKLYSSLDDGWCSERDRPAGLAGKIIARIPPAEGLAG